MFSMLPPEQRGWLFTAIYAYAQQLSREEAAQAGELETMEAVLDSIPEMDAQTRMAFSFVASTIYRDTRKWYAQRRARTERKSRQPAPAQNELDGGTLLRQDMARLRRLMKQTLWEEQEGGGGQETV